MILPMTVIRRLDAVLEASKQQVLQHLKVHSARPEEPRHIVDGRLAPRYRQAALARPSTFSKVPRLFFVGGGVHPGAGAPMVLMGARRVASGVMALALASDSSSGSRQLNSRMARGGWS